MLKVSGILFNVSFITVWIISFLINFSFDVLWVYNRLPIEGRLWIIWNRCVSLRTNNRNWIRLTKSSKRILFVMLVKHRSDNIFEKMLCELFNLIFMVMCNSSRSQILYKRTQNNLLFTFAIVSLYKKIWLPCSGGVNLFYCLTLWICVNSCSFECL